MAVVAPLPGLRFSERDLSGVIAPPFDVISREEQARLYDRSPNNVVRLELGRSDDPYAEALDAYSRWRKDGTLREDPPSLYLYEQRFALGGQRLTRRGLIARIKLEPWSAGVVLPHEATHNKAKADRLQLMRTIWANVSPVFGLYEDPDRRLGSVLDEVFQRPAAATGVDDLGDEHRLWQVVEGPLSRDVTEFFQGRQLFIADGHHRYETALALRDVARGLQPPPAGAEFVMMALVDMADPGLKVLPTHRLLRDLTPPMMARLAGRLGEYFEVVAAADAPSPKALEQALERLESVEGPAFAMYGPLPGGLRLLALKPEWRGHTFEAGHCPAWNGLDVSVLHAIIGTEILGISAEDMAAQRFFSYIQEPAEAVRSVQRGESQLALMLRSTPVTALRDISLAGDKMPQKSTFFYPKLATGLVINPLDR